MENSEPVEQTFEDYVRHEKSSAEQNPRKADREAGGVFHEELFLLD